MIDRQSILPAVDAWRSGFSAAIHSIYTGGPNPAEPAEVQSFRAKVIDAIHGTIRDEFGLDPSIIYANSRKHDTVMLRVFSWEIYQMLTGDSQKQTMVAFKSLRSRSTFANMKKNIISSLDYSPSYKQDFQRFLFGVQMRLSATTKNNRARFVDLGLPSGTRWSDRNLIGFHGAPLLGSPLFSLSVPRQEDFEELVEECDASWDDILHGISFVGKNGQSIFFPADGYETNRKNYTKGTFGFYLLNRASAEKNIFKFYRTNVTAMTFSKTDLDLVSVSVRPISK